MVRWNRNYCKKSFKEATQSKPHKVFMMHGIGINKTLKFYQQITCCPYTLTLAISQIPLKWLQRVYTTMRQRQQDRQKQMSSAKNTCGQWQAPRLETGGALAREENLKEKWLQGRVVGEIDSSWSCEWMAWSRKQTPHQKGYIPSPTSQQGNWVNIYLFVVKEDPRLTRSASWSTIARLIFPRERTRVCLAVDANFGRVWIWFVTPKLTL